MNGPLQSRLKVNPNQVTTKSLDVYLNERRNVTLNKLLAESFFSRKLRERVLLKNSCSIDHQHDKTIADHQPLTTANDKTIADHQPLTTANDKTIADHQPLTTANDETIADHHPLTTANDETIAEKKRSAVKIC